MLKCVLGGDYETAPRRRLPRPECRGPFSGEEAGLRFTLKQPMCGREICEPHFAKNELLAER